MDKLTPQQRHKAMAAIRGKDTKPEMIVRRGLWKRGFRYRLNHKRLPGHPDLVLRKYRTCIFVNGCFWHGHNVTLNIKDETLNFGSSESQHVRMIGRVVTKVNEVNITNSECCKIPKTNREFWVKKIRRNQQRDIEDQQRLAAMGWHCITVWECELTSKKREETLDSLAYTLNHIYLQDHQIPKPYPTIEEESGLQMAAEEL
ncbi:MAG: very short patch repair endonuclease [Prevotella sp.]|nr:very short patch repair endonuclease [Prevotella sp.]